MKTLNAEDFIEKNGDIHTTPGADQILYVSNVIGLLDEYAAQFKPEWISVKERLPEGGSKVLVYGDDSIDTAFYHKAEHEFWTHGSILRNITHWSVTPESPKDKTTEICHK